jgi:hypothetical protein
MKWHNLKIESKEVRKYGDKYGSSFCAYYLFTTGQSVEMPLTDKRPEFFYLEKMDTNQNDDRKAAVIALEQYEKFEQFVADGAIAYTRATFKGFFGEQLCNVYLRDETSPTGVKLGMGIAMKVVESFKITTLSPTEGRRVAV